LSSKGNPTVERRGFGFRAVPEKAFDGRRGDVPTYAYICKKCGKEYEVVQTMSEHGRKKPACPKCKSRSVDQVFTPFLAKTSKKS